MVFMKKTLFFTEFCKEALYLTKELRIHVISMKCTQVLHSFISKNIKLNFSLILILKLLFVSDGSHEMPSVSHRLNEKTINFIRCL